ncbi:hypothetical protein D3C85_1730810 [compost metagenome]
MTFSALVLAVGHARVIAGTTRFARQQALDQRGVPVFELQFQFLVVVVRHLAVDAPDQRFVVVIHGISPSRRCIGYRQISYA